MNFFLFLLLVISFPILNQASDTTLVYQKSSGKGTYKTTYNIQKKDQTINVFVDSKDQTTAIETSASYQLKSFMNKSKKNEDYYRLVLNNSVLKAEGHQKGEKLAAQFNIDSKTPWVQEFDFGLRPFLESKKTSLNFQLINPKTFKIHKMVAKKQGIETITIGDKTYKAELVNITLQGFKSMFWKALIWYDETTHDLLMYKSNEGPHTPTTTISLVSKTDAAVKKA